MMVFDDPLFDALAAASIPTISEFQGTDLAKLAWALAKLRLPDLPLLDALAPRLLRTAMIVPRKRLRVLLGRWQSC